MGSSITYEERTGDNACELYYAYDKAGKLYGFYYDGTEKDGFYYYKRNLQGDIIGILDSPGITVVTYEYDSWDNPISTTGTLASTVGSDNPFHYRGYYYDDETSLYYLNQRYYNPEWGRFINADDLLGQTGDLGRHNVFAYCQNNPVMFSDPSGRFLLAALAIGPLIGGAVLLGGCSASVDDAHKAIDVLEKADVVGTAVGSAMDFYEMDKIASLEDVALVNDYQNVTNARKLMEGGISAKDAANSVDLLPVAVAGSAETYRNTIGLALHIGSSNTFDYGTLGNPIGQGVLQIKVKELITALNGAIGIMEIVSPPFISDYYSAYGELAEYMDNKSPDIYFVYGDMGSK